MEQKFYYIVLRPEYINTFPQFEGRVIAKDGTILCRSVKHGVHYLETEAHLEELSGEVRWFYLSIHHSAVLYIVSSPEDNVNRILGFHSSQQSENPQTEEIPH